MRRIIEEYADETRLEEAARPARALLAPGWRRWAHGLLLAGLLIALHRGIAADAFTWTFETGLDGWRPRAKTITLTRVPADRAASRGALRIQGRIEGGWNYALCEHRPMTAGRLYRLTAWLRVDRLGPGTPPPYLKCEFVGPKGTPAPGQVHTTVYDPAQAGQWQQLSCEFAAPAGTEAFWLAVEKGTREPAQIDALLDDVMIQPIARLSVLEQYRLKPLPAALQAVQGVHPRLYLDAARLQELRQAIQTTHAALWKEFLARADQAARRSPPAYRQHDTYSGDEQLWQRGVGNTLPVLALAWAVTQEPRYLNAARQWALASCQYPTWGLGRIDGLDLAAGHQLFGLGLVYDWCYDALDEPARRTIRQTLVRRGSAMFEAAAMGQAWWRRSYLQNHLWVNACGLAVAGLAVFDEVEDATLWLGLALDKFQRTMAALGPDGASHEGVGYWEYGVEYLLKFMALARRRLGVDLYPHDWWRHTARYAQYLSLPRRAWTRDNCVVDLADCPRHHWYGPDYLLRALAHEFQDPHAQWLAQQIDDANLSAPGAPWLNLLWFDPAIPAAPPAALPTLRHFDDLGIVSARSDWSGEEALVVLKCGPFIGHHAIQQFSYDPGGGHVHPDANHFVLFGAGEWLIRDDGYRAKWSGQHNTLLIDGRGQLGEGRQWFQGSQPLAVKARPRIVRAVSTPALDQITGDAAEAYPAGLGVRHFRRHLLFVKPDVLLVCDDIVLDKPRELELRFHPESRRSRRSGQGFIFTGRQSVLRLEPVAGASDVEVSTADLAIEGRHNESNLTMFTVRLRRRAAVWRNVVALSWSPAGQSPPTVNAQAAGQRWQFTVRDRVVTFDWNAGQARHGG